MLLVPPTAAASSNVTFPFLFFFGRFVVFLLLLKGGHSKYQGRTYRTHKNLYNYLFLLTIFGPIYYGPP